jgi:WD40 repeat protein
MCLTFLSIICNSDSDHPASICEKVKHIGPVISVSLSKNGKLLASCSCEFVHITDVETGQTLRIIQQNDMILSVSLSADGKLLATSSADKTARIIDVATGKTLRTIHHK